VGLLPYQQSIANNQSFSYILLLYHSFLPPLRCVFQHVVDPADANAIVDAIEIGGVIASIGCIELSEAAFDATDELLRCCTLYASPGKNKEEISMDDKKCISYHFLTFSFPLLPLPRH